MTPQSVIGHLQIDAHFNMANGQTNFLLDLLQVLTTLVMVIIGFYHIWIWLTCPVKFILGQAQVESQKMATQVYTNQGTYSRQPMQDPTGRHPSLCKFKIFKQYYL